MPTLLGMTMGDCDKPFDGSDEIDGRGVSHAIEEIEEGERLRRG